MRSKNQGWLERCSGVTSERPWGLGTREARCLGSFPSLRLSYWRPGGPLREAQSKDGGSREQGLWGGLPGLPWHPIIHSPYFEEICMEFHPSSGDDDYHKFGACILSNVPFLGSKPTSQPPLYLSSFPSDSSITLHIFHRWSLGASGWALLDRLSPIGSITSCICRQLTCSFPASVFSHPSFIFFSHLLVPWISLVLFLSTFSSSILSFLKWEDLR